MLYANIEGSNEKVKATKSSRGTCPLCGKGVIAKCGEINAHHWAHESLDECDSWGEGETDWHIGWKNKFPPEWNEVTIVKDGERHRADVMTNYGTVLELQHSPISPDVIRERERFYASATGKEMIWLFDATDIADNLTFWLSGINPRIEFSWRHFKKYLSFVTAKLYIDLGNGWVFRITGCGDGGEGWGYPMRYECFIRVIISIKPQCSNFLPMIDVLKTCLIQERSSICSFCVLWDKDDNWLQKVWTGKQIGKYKLTKAVHGIGLFNSGGLETYRNSYTTTIRGSNYLCNLKKSLPHHDAYFEEEWLKIRLYREKVRNDFRRLELARLLSPALYLGKLKYDLICQLTSNREKIGY